MHLALIMDGNGRWAERRGLSRSEGHKEGARVACRVAKAASDRGIGYLTLYCFSTENWKRPKGEVDSLMGLFSSELETMIGRLVENGIRVLHLGRRDRLPEMVLRRRAMRHGEKELSVPVLSRYVDNPSIPYPDFICRSSGEKRLSGFLMLQSSYAEIGFYDRLWPDWDESMIDTIIADFSARDRRYGGIR